MRAGKASASTTKRTTKEKKVVEEEGPGDEDEEGEEFDWPPLVCCFGEAHYEFLPTVRPFERQMDEDIYSSWKGLQWSPPEFARAPGTSPSNVAIALARLGGRVVFVGKVANDVFGNELLMTLNENGVQTRGVKIADCYGTAVSQMRLTCGTGSGVQMTCESPSVESTLQSEDVDLDILKEVHQLCMRASFVSLSRTRKPNLGLIFCVFIIIIIMMMVHMRTVFSLKCIYLTNVLHWVSGDVKFGPIGMDDFHQSNWSFVKD